MNALPATPEENDQFVREAVAPLVEAVQGRTVFLVDADRTLAAGDSSRDFLREAGADPRPVKDRFQSDGYVFPAFRYHAEFHLALGEGTFAALVPRIASRTRLHRGAAEFLRIASARSRVVILTAGLPRIWRAIIDGCGLHDVDIVGGIEPRRPFVFGRREKGLVTGMFLEAGATIVGVGDSDVDAEMLLQSHHAVVVVNHRRNDDLLPSVKDHRSLWQVVPEGDPHPGIRQLQFSEIPGLLDRA